MARIRKQDESETNLDHLMADAEPAAAEGKTRVRRRAGHGSATDSGPRRRLLIWLIFAFFLVVFVAAIALAYQFETFLATDARFRLPPIQQDGLLLPGGPVQVTGLEYLAEGDVVRQFENDTGRSLYLLPLKQRREELLAIDWIAEASITRLWPNGLRVYVRERVPVALAALPGTRSGDPYNVKLIDAEGLLMRKPEPNPFDLPLVFGLREDHSVELRAARVELLLRLQREVEALQARFSELDVSDPNNLQATMVLDGRNVTLLLGSDKYLMRVQNFMEHYEAVIRANPRANLFDMRLEDKIIATRRGLSGA